MFAVEVILFLSKGSQSPFTMLLVDILTIESSLGTLPKKKRDFLGIFHKGGGGSSRFPKLLKINQVIFGMPKSISDLMCQNMFYNSGEVISDQFNHIALDSKSGKF